MFTGTRCRFIYEGMMEKRREKLRWTEVTAAAAAVTLSCRDYFSSQDVTKALSNWVLTWLLDVVVSYRLCLAAKVFPRPCKASAEGKLNKKPGECRKVKQTAGEIFLRLKYAAIINCRH